MVGLGSAEVMLKEEKCLFLLKPLGKCWQKGWRTIRTGSSHRRMAAIEARGARRGGKPPIRDLRFEQGLQNRVDGDDCQQGAPAARHCRPITYSLAM